MCVYGVYIWCVHSEKKLLVMCVRCVYMVRSKKKMLVMCVRCVYMVRSKKKRVVVRFAVFQGISFFKRYFAVISTT